MSATKTSVQDRYRDAEQSILPLIELATVDHSREVTELADSVRIFSDTAAKHLIGLPSARGDHAQLTNMLADAGRLLAEGDFGTARWTLTQLKRKLARFGDKWADDSRPKRTTNWV